MKPSLLILTILLTHFSFAQGGYDIVPGRYDTVFKRPEYVRVKILKIRTIAPVTKVKMKTLARPRVKFTTECRCEIFYRRKDIVFIEKPW